MKKSTSCFYILMWLTTAVFQVSGQSRQELEKQRLQIIKEIEKTTRELESTQKDKKKYQNLLKSLNKQLETRKKLIDNLSSTLKVNETLIGQNKETLARLQANQEKLQKQYSHLLRRQFVSRRANSEWVYILSAENINRLILRWRYTRQFDQFARYKLEEIKQLSGSIAQKNQEIERTTEENKRVLEESNQNMKILLSEQKEKDKLLQNLTKNEQKLRKDLKKREKERENLNKSIERIILAELAKSKEKEKEDVSVTRKKEIDNSSFAKNKGVLEWPVQSGSITGKFGTSPHPTIKNVQVSNNGIDISLTRDDAVYCIFDGEVVGVTSIPGFKNMLIIRHGSYYSVYSKLDNVFVSKGDKIKRKQKIGQVIREADGRSELHFELWKDKMKLDPEKWLEKK
jgi:septal ring factor EnvC (AmiA/AmiB activator)